MATTAAVQTQPPEASPAGSFFAPKRSVVRTLARPTKVIHLCSHCCGATQWTLGWDHRVTATKGVFELAKTMLQPPGSGRSRPTPSSRRKTQESPDDLIRQLQRLPPNKRCADCTSKLPQCANVTVGSFVCIACGGIHRELNQRVKGVGHSTFTMEEVDFMKATDNDRVNATYLARYNPSVERMRPPTDNTDQQHLRAWIHCKYRDKAWYSPQGGGSAASAPSASAPQQQQQQQQQQRGQYGQPTVAQMPPKQEVDLFGGGYTSSTPSPSPAQTNHAQGRWNAFGGSGSGQPSAPSPQAQPAFQANFADFPNQPQPPQPSPQRPGNDFPADFGSSHTKQQVHQAPSPHQPEFQANFAEFSAQQSPRGGPQAHQQQQQPQQQPSQQPSFRANFPQPSPQQFGPPQSQGGFANFQQQPPQQQMAPSQQHMLPQQHQGGFSNFNQMSPAPAQQQIMPNFPQQQGGQQSQMTGQQQQNQPGPPFQANFGPSQQSFGVGSVAGGLPGQHPPPLPSQPLAPSQGNSGQPLPQPGQGQQPQRAAAVQAPVQASVPGQQSSTLSVSSAAEAISNLSVNGDTSVKASGPDSNKTEKEPATSKFRKGQKVYYKSASYMGSAQIVNVHFDHELEPFYTIAVEGKEKQTDDKHLSLKSPAQEEIEAMLQHLPEPQLKQVHEFVSKLKGTGDAPRVQTPSPMQVQAPPPPQQQVSTGGMNATGSQFNPGHIVGAAPVNSASNHSHPGGTQRPTQEAASPGWDGGIPSPLGSSGRPTVQSVSAPVPNLQQSAQTPESWSSGVASPGAMGGGSRSQSSQVHEGSTHSTQLAGNAAPQMQYAVPQSQMSNGTMQVQAQSVPMTAGMMQQNQMPPGMIQQNQMPPGMIQQNQMPPGMIQQNQMPPGMIQQNQMPPGMMQHGQMPPGMMQHGQVPPGMMQHGQVPPGMMQQGQLQPGMMQQGQMPPGMRQHGQMPPTIPQQGQMPTGTMQQGQVPPGLAHGMHEHGHTNVGTMPLSQGQTGMTPSSMSLGTQQSSGYSGIPSPQIVSQEGVSKDVRNAIPGPPLDGQQQASQTYQQMPHMQAPPSQMQMAPQGQQMQYGMPQQSHMQQMNGQPSRPAQPSANSAPLSPKGNPFDIY